MQSIIMSYIKDWESKCYSDGIPDEAPSELGIKVPSYKMICRAILRNDRNLLTLGYSRPHNDYYNELKRKELGIKQYQMRLFL